MNKCFYLIIAVFILSLFFTEPIYALVSVSVSPTEGGNSLRFGRIDFFEKSDKELRLHILSDESKQYQIFQRIIEPLTNERGQMINQPVILSSSLPNSNSSGSLYLQTFEFLSSGEQLIYTSNPGGSSDSFSIVYRIDPERFSSRGTFNGKILYTVRLVGGSTQQTEILNIFVDLTDEFRLDTKASSGKNSVQLNSIGRNLQEGYFQLSYSGSGRQTVRIYQEIIDFPRNTQNFELPPEIISFTTTGGVDGPLTLSNLKNFQRGRILLYETNLDDDVFTIRYSLDQEQAMAAKAGNYDGHIQYSVECGHIHETINLKLNVNISPEFRIELKYSGNSVSFEHVIPTDSLRESEVAVSVKTNLGKPYQVTQSMSSFLTNEKGREIKDNKFTMKGEYAEVPRGRVYFNEAKPVEVGDVVLYTSDEKGSPADFKIIYQLQPSWEFEAGNYSTSIIYSLGEI